MMHGICIDWSYEEESCACGYVPTEGSPDEGYSSIPDLEKHLREAWFAELTAKVEAVRAAQEKFHDDWNSQLGANAHQTSREFDRAITAALAAEGEA